MFFYETCRFVDKRHIKFTVDYRYYYKYEYSKIITYISIIIGDICCYPDQFLLLISVPCDFIYIKV
jgi:hypothetical protein